VYEYLAEKPEYTGGPVSHPALIGALKDVNVGTGRIDLIGNALNDILHGTHKLFLYGRIVYTTCSEWRIISALGSTTSPQQTVSACLKIQTTITKIRASITASPTVRPNISTWPASSLQQNDSSDISIVHVHDSAGPSLRFDLIGPTRYTAQLIE